MISNNKNKISKELTLEEIIQKSALRKNIDSLCLIQPKHNKNQNRPSAQTQTPTYLNKRFQQLLDFEYFPSKNPIQFVEKIKNKAKNSLTTRTVKSSKQIVMNTNSNQQFLSKNLKRIAQDQQRLHKQFISSNQNTTILLEKKHSVKNRNKVHSDYLCVKGASGPIIKSLTADANIPEYEMKKYQTLVQLGSQFHKKQQSLQFATVNQEQAESTNYHSFMLTKYTTSNNFRKKSIKSIENRTNSSNKLRTNVIFPQQLAVNKKVKCRGIKTEEKNRVKVDNGQEIDGTRNKRMKKFELILGVNHEDQLRNKQKQAGQSSNMKTDNMLQLKIQQAQTEIIQKDISPSKQASEDSLNRSNSKGFKGIKRKTVIAGEKIKSRYFIPDFIKPSLDLVMFQKKIVEVIKTQEKQNKSQQPKEIIEPDECAYSDLNNEADCIRGKLLNLNYKVKEVRQELNEIDQEANFEDIQKITFEDQDKNIEINPGTLRRKNTNKSKKKKRELQNQMNQYQNLEICGWDGYENFNLKQKNRMFMNAAAELFQL